MRDLYREYLEGKISWDEAYRTANNCAATASGDIELEDGEVDYYAGQMETLGVRAAEKMMELLGYSQDKDGLYYKPGESIE